MKNKRFAAIACLAAVSMSTDAFASTVEIRHYPGDAAIVLPMPGEGVPPGIHSAILHNIAIVNGGKKSTRIGSLTLTLKRGEETVGTVNIGAPELAAAARKWSGRQQAGMLEVYGAVFQTSRFLKGVTLSGSADLPPATGLLITSRPLVFQGAADTVVITALSGSGARLAEKSVGLRIHRSSNSYTFPLRGRWFVAAGPSLQSHHRWGMIQEFALDLATLGKDGRTHEQDGSRAANYHAFGAPVLAAAAGTVVAAVDRFGDDDSLRRRGESEEEFVKRAGTRQAELLQLGMAGIMGNHVVIDHGNGEFGYYAHLKQGSVAVSKGDKIKPGQKIGALGNSGNSTQPHLHFHIADGPDATFSRSLPVVFTNVAVFENGDGGSGILNTGHIVETTGD